MRLGGRFEDMGSSGHLVPCRAGNVAREIVTRAFLRLAEIGRRKVSFDQRTCFSRVFHPFCRTDTHPRIGFDKILRYTAAFFIHYPEIVLCLSKTLLGGQAKPADRFGIVLRQPLALALGPRAWPSHSAIALGRRPWPSHSAIDWIESSDHRQRTTRAHRLFFVLDNQVRLTRLVVQRKSSKPFRSIGASIDANLNVSMTPAQHEERRLGQGSRGSRTGEVLGELVNALNMRGIIDAIDETPLI